MAEIGWEDLEWIDVSHDTNMEQPVVTHVNTLRTGDADLRF